MIHVPRSFSFCLFLLNGCTASGSSRDGSDEYLLQGKWEWYGSLHLRTADADERTILDGTVGRWNGVQSFHFSTTPSVRKTSQPHAALFCNFLANHFIFRGMHFSVRQAEKMSLAFILSRNTPPGFCHPLCAFVQREIDADTVICHKMTKEMRFANAFQASASNRARTHRPLFQGIPDKSIPSTQKFLEKAQFLVSVQVRTQASVQLRIFN